MIPRSFLICVAAAASAYAAVRSPDGNPVKPAQLSGIYPHLAMFNDENECGTGAVVPWADRLWVVTYAPHQPHGSTDKLYEITPDLQQIIRPESIGGTPANRMVHRESEQLFIGPYAIDRDRGVRVIPYEQMPGRPTGNARHLFDPANKIYYATMEEGFYEVNVHTLAVRELYPDGHANGDDFTGDLFPGYHGKGLYSGQGRLVYANNGERTPEALRNPETPSGVLAEWDGVDWTIVRRNQFTEVTGPGGIHGNGEAASDPIWSIGWDHRSLILMLRDGGTWHSFRLPKSSHSYDGAHGWNTEWPRIREIGEGDDLLMTMHGAFWRFPKTFSANNTAGIRPRSNYLKVIGDFARWGDRIVSGCDDTAKMEFLNKRRAKGEIPAPQSQSNLWFIEPEKLDALGTVIGRGGPWIEEDVAGGTTSDPFLVAGFDAGYLHLAHKADTSASVSIEVDRDGTGAWDTLEQIELPPHGYLAFRMPVGAEWIRLAAKSSLRGATAQFILSNRDNRIAASSTIFNELARMEDKSVMGGLIHARADNHRTLALAAMDADGDGGYYELDGNLKLRRVNDPAAHAFVRDNLSIPVGFLAVDDASVIFTDDAGTQWRLPRGDPALDHDGPLGPSRADREVATERDLFNAHGTFYELPANNAGGFAKLRPVATHNRRIHDYCSYRGLFIMTGITADASADNPHIIRSDDSQAALWVGAIDDIWKLGKPRGTGGPWRNTAIDSGVPSDPYLMTAYDRKTLNVSHDSKRVVDITVEVDLTGSGIWVMYRSFSVPPGESIRHEFPDGYSAYWLRTIASQSCRATAQLTYE